MDAYSNGPIWNAFGLTYANYAVFPRRALMSMPTEWQQRLLDLMTEAHNTLEDGAFDGDYTIVYRVNGKIAKDPMREYRHTGPVAHKESKP